MTFFKNFLHSINAWADEKWKELDSVHAPPAFSFDIKDVSKEGKSDWANFFKNIRVSPVPKIDIK